jgi:hypothetical protein
MYPQNNVLRRPAQFTREEMLALLAQRERFKDTRDLLTEAEVAHLRFVCYLYETGRIDH